MGEIPNEKSAAARAEKIGRLTDEATGYLNANAQLYDKILGDIRRTLEELVEGMSWTVHGRVKSAKSLREKILRKGYYKNHEDGASIIKDLPDLIGVRVQCLLNQHEKRAYELLQNKRESLDEAGFSAYQTKNGAVLSLLLQNQPEKQKNGHDIFRIEGKYHSCELEEPVHFELQIKSMVHAFWGELEHSMFYKNYDFFISQKILTQSMDNILAELDLIDRELEGLQDHIWRNNADRIKELKSVGVSVIQKKYQDIFDKRYGCKLDLRAAYWLIVEILFNNTVTEEKAVQKLSEMIQQCKNSNIADAQRIVPVKLNADAVSPDKKQCVLWLDKLVSENVYWETFFYIYITLRQDEDSEYKDWLEDIARRLLRLNTLNTFAGDFSDRDFTQCICHALIFGSNEKLEYFMEEKNLKSVQDKISGLLKGSVFENYEHGAEQEGFDKESALKSVFLWTGCLIDFMVHGYIERQKVEELRECLNKENIFPVDIEEEQLLECFDKAEKLSGQKAAEIQKRLFVWEEEK